MGCGDFGHDGTEHEVLVKRLRFAKFMPFVFASFVAVVVLLTALYFMRPESEERVGDVLFDAVRDVSGLDSGVSALEGSDRSVLSAFQSDDVIDIFVDVSLAERDDFDAEAWRFAELERCGEWREALLKERSGVAVERDHDGCVLRGDWSDYGTGSIVRDAGELVVVPLLSARVVHDGGGFVWGPEERLEYTEFVREGGMLVMSRDDASARGEGSVADWVPELPERRCDYARRYARAKEWFVLASSGPEAYALRENLFLCGDGLTMRFNFVKRLVE